MSFASNVFVFYFFPISLLLVIIANKISKEAYKIVLLLLSYIFCFWLGKSTLLFALLISIILYFYQYKRSLSPAIVLIIILTLLFYKYTPILYKESNAFINGFINMEPIAISFVSLSAISFCVDLSKNNKNVSFVEASLFISYFPKYISGPIVKWNDFVSLIDDSKINLDRVVDGLIYFIKGFAYKIIIADTILNSIQPIINSSYRFNSISLIICIFVYSFVIYFDFLGYSKMAKGISLALGIELIDNFNKPYTSRSISEFYRRWHISLGNFFKEYVYIPLGGNKKHLYINIFIVMLISGIWHGNGSAYIIWGTINGLIMAIERKYPIKRGIVFILVTFVVVSILWMPFMLGSVSKIFQYLVNIITNVNVSSLYGLEYYFNVRTIIILVVAILLSFFDFDSIEKTIKSKFLFIYYLLMVLLFILSILFMINSSYSPFIYFRF